MHKREHIFFLIIYSCLPQSCSQEKQKRQQVFSSEHWHSGIILESQAGRRTIICDIESGMFQVPLIHTHVPQLLHWLKGAHLLKEILHPVTYGAEKG